MYSFFNPNSYRTIRSAQNKQWTAVQLVVTAVSLMSFTASAQSPVTVTNTASADAFVRSAVPTLNYGAAGALSVSGSTATNASGVANGAFDSFVRFNTATMVTSLNAQFGANGWAIKGANLIVTEVGAPNNAIFNRGKGSFEIRWIANDNWTEGTGTPTAPATSGITYSSEATLLNSGTDATLGTYTNAGVNGALTFGLALSAAFTNSLQTGGDVVLFMIAISSEIGFTFDAREFGTASARPILVISVGQIPAITIEPQSSTNDYGSSVALSVTAIGDAPLAYQWYRGASPVANATGTSLNFTAASATAGAYTVVVTNNYGSITSGTATVTVMDPVITEQPQSRTGAAGSNVVVTITADGTPALGYQWFFASTAIAGAVEPSLSISNFQSADEGKYYVVVTNALGSITSEPVMLYLDWPLRFVARSASSNGMFATRLVGPVGSNFVIQGWIQGTPWTSIVTNHAVNGIFDFRDAMMFPDTNSPDGLSSTNRFYRGWLAP